MGHNRGGDRAKLKKKRRLKQERRVLAKAERATSTADKPAGDKTTERPGVLSKVKDLAKSAAHAVSDLVKTGVEKVKGSSE